MRRTSSSSSRGHTRPSTHSARLNSRWYTSPCVHGSLRPEQPREGAGTGQASAVYWVQVYVFPFQKLIQNIQELASKYPIQAGKGIINQQHGGQKGDHKSKGQKRKVIKERHLAAPHEAVELLDGGGVGEAGEVVAARHGEGEGGRAAGRGRDARLPHQLRRAALR